MNTDKAYLLGLVIGGGVFGNAEEVFKIKLPYKKWGSYLDNPERAGKIAGDILNKVGQMFRAIYGISVQYETTEGGTWSILCEGDTSSLRSDLNKYGIECNGEIRGTANINKLVVDLVDDNLKRRFIAGLADTIGSMAKSHRRFSDEHQILSFEIKGYNFQFVCDLCRLLYSINSPAGASRQEIPSLERIHGESLVAPSCAASRLICSSCAVVRETGSTVRVPSSSTSPKMASYSSASRCFSAHSCASE